VELRSIGTRPIPNKLKIKIVHRYLLHNGEIRDSTEALLSPGQTGYLNGWGVFTTLRVSNGVLFAFERHYARMRRDAERLRVPFEISPEELEKTLLTLVEANRALNATLRVAVVRNRGGLFEAAGISRDADLVAFMADLTSWASGVHLSYVPNGRFGACPFAGAKITSWAQNLTWNEDAHQRGFDEVILLNEHGHISECTSANIFCVQGEYVYTPPLATSGCLPGITRAVLLEETRLPGLTICEKELTPADLANSEQVFITSTTRDLLPVLTADRQPLPQSDRTLGRLQQAFLRYRESYAASHGLRAFAQAGPREAFAV
jgi:branched-chain amino acid aminotransferase